MTSAAILPLLVPQGTQADLAGEVERVKAMRPTVEQIVLHVRGPEDEQFLADVRQHLAERMKAHEAQRKTISVPLDQAKKAVDALFRPLRESYQELDDFIREFLTKLETARREAARLAQETAKQLAAGGDLAAAEAALPEAQAKPQGVNYVESWVLESADLFALVRACATRPEFMCFLSLNDAAVKAYLKTYKTSSVVPEVPGLTFKKVAEARRG